MEKPKVYRALQGINYPNPDFDPEDEDSRQPEEIRVEAGDKIEDVPDDWARVQANQDHTEEWVDRQTENVKDESGVTVTGVMSRHANEGVDIVLREVSE